MYPRCGLISQTQECFSTTLRESEGENAMSPLYLRIPLLDSCNSESATGTNSQMPKSLNSGFQVNCIRKSPVWSEGCGGGGKGRLTHSRWPDGFTHRGSRMQRGHQHKAHRCPVWSQILTHSHVVRGRGGSTR